MKVSDLRGILTYIPGFREKTFVIALDGTIIADDNFPNLLLDLAVLRSLSIRLVIVHGAAHQIQELAKQAGVTVSNADGTGITDAETLKLALTAANRITHEVLEGLASSDLRAAYTNAVIAHPFGIVGGVDQLYTGRVEKVDVDFLNRLLEQGRRSRDTAARLRWRWTHPSGSIPTEWRSRWPRRSRPRSSSS